MAGFRISHPAIQWTDDLGNLVPEGKLVFSESGGSTPKSVYSNADGTGSLGAELDLDTAARAPDFFMVGEYRVRLLDADDDQVWLRDNVRDVASGGVVPLDPADGDDLQVYSTDGITAYWRTILELPDPTGSDGYFVIADGSGYSLQAPAAEEDSEVGVSATSTGYVWNNGVLDQWGTGTAPTAAGLHTSVAITFGIAFDSAPWHVDPCPVLSSGVTSNSPPGFPSRAYSSPSTSGCTVHFFVGEENNGGTDTINSTIPFTWRAVGPKATAPA